MSVVDDSGRAAAQKAGPLVTSAVLATATTLLVIGFVVLMRPDGGDASPSAAALAAATGSPLGNDKIGCGGGEELTSAFEIDGRSFKMVGKLASVESGGSLLVKGPRRYVKMKVEDSAKNANVSGRGAVKVEGKIDEGQQLTATKITQACKNTPSPTATPRSSSSPGSDSSAAASSAPQATAKPTDNPEPTPKLEPTEEVTQTPEPTPGATEPPGKTPKPAATAGVEGTTAP